MNGQPHTHNLNVLPCGTCIRVAYGDQQSKLVSVKIPFWRSRVQRVAKRMIRRHDHHSRKALFNVEKTKKATAALKEALPLGEGAGVWGYDVVRGKATYSRVQVRVSYNATTDCPYVIHPPSEYDVSVGTRSAVERYCDGRGYEPIYVSEAPSIVVPDARPIDATTLDATTLHATIQALTKGALSS